MEKIYIAGCGGMLGEAFYIQFKDLYIIKCTDIDLNEEWLSFCDITDYEQYRQSVIEFNPDYLFHLGALTDLEYSENHDDETYLTNTLAVENAVLIANELNIPVLYISTAGIFNGKKELYDDWDIPNPIGHYARSKYAGEKFVVENAKRFIVGRAGWMMGGGPRKDKKFIHKIIKQIKENKKNLFVVNDKFGTPTYTHDFAKNIKLILMKQYWGLYNIVCEGVTSRLEVAHEILKILHLEESITITEVDSNYFKNDYFAPRPDSERLLNRKLNLRNLNEMRHWKNALKEYILEYYKNYLR